MSDATAQIKIVRPIAVEARRVAILFAREDSVYKTLPGCDVYDSMRDALTFTGGMPVVAHPPCRAWGRLRHFAKPRPGERELALWAVEQVRTFGGVLEHPYASRLWEEAALPKPGERDAFGGFTLWVLQWWFGHRAGKPTLLYIVGVRPRELPPLPFAIGEPEFVIESRKRKGPTRRPSVSKTEREATPKAMAEWLIAVARRVALAGSGSRSAEG